MIPGELPEFDTPDALTVMVEKVKAAYMLYRRTIHRNWQPSYRWEKCWLTTAKLLMEHNWDPDTYICVQFQSVTPFPQPNMLYNTDARNNMLHAIGEGSPVANTLTKIAAEVSFWQSRLNSFKSAETALEMAARNPSISALFLFCAARQFNLDGSQWIENAIKTMHMKPIADAYRDAQILTPAIEAEISEWISRRHPK